MKHFRSLLLMLLLMLALCVGVSAKNECRLYDMTLKTESGEALDHISKGYFWASVSAKKTSDLNATILLATYDSAGRYLGLYTMRTNVPTGTVYELGALVDNTAGKIAALKAFAVDSLSGACPLGASIEYGKRSYTVETGEMGRPVLSWSDGTTEPATPIQSYDDGVSSSDLWSECGMSADQSLDLYVNGQYKGVVRLGNIIAFGLLGRLTEVYSDRIVMIDTFLARVADIRKAEYAENGQLRHEAEISLNVWDDAVTHDANDSSAVRVCSLRNGSEDYPYDVGDYVLVWGHTAENNSVESSGKLTAVTQILGCPEEFTGLQTAAWSYGRHTIDGNTIADSHKYRLDEAGTDTGKYTWFLDPYGYLIGSIGKSADSENEGFILVKGTAWSSTLKTDGSVKYNEVDIQVPTENGAPVTVKILKDQKDAVDNTDLLTKIITDSTGKLFYIAYSNGFAVSAREIDELYWYETGDATGKGVLKLTNAKMPSGVDGKILTGSFTAGGTTTSNVFNVTEATQVIGTLAADMTDKNLYLIFDGKNNSIDKIYIF